MRWNKKKKKKKKENHPYSSLAFPPSQDWLWVREGVRPEVFILRNLHPLKPRPQNPIFFCHRHNFDYPKSHFHLWMALLLKPNTSLKRMASRFFTFSSPSSIHSFHSHARCNLALSSSFSLSTPSCILPPTG